MKRGLLLLVVLLAFLVGSTVGIYTVLTSQRSLHVWDFQPLWQAGRWVLAGRGSPYTQELTHLLQMQSYGRSAEPGEDDRAFVYPLYVLLLVMPLIPLPLAWAQAAWFTVLQAAVVVSAVGAVSLARWRMRLGQIVLTVIWALLLYPLAWALVLGQVAILVSALIVVTLLALSRDRGFWAGLCLALTTVKPQMSFLLVPALLSWAFVARRYRFLLSFAGAFALLFLASFAVLPTWLAGMLRAGASYFEVQPFSPPVAMPGRAIGGGQGAVVTVILTAGLLAGLAWTWWRERRSCEAPIKAAAVTLVVSTLIAPRTSVVNQASLLLPICSLLAGVARQGRLGRIAALGLQAALLVSLWIVDLLLFPALSSGEHWRAQHRILSPILPTVLLLGLMTRRWWAAGRRK